MSNHVMDIVDTGGVDIATQSETLSSTDHDSRVIQYCTVPVVEVDLTKLNIIAWCNVKACNLSLIRYTNKKAKYDIVMNAVNL